MSHAARKLLLQAVILAAILIACFLLAPPARAGSPLLYGSVGGNGAWLTGVDASWPADFEANGNVWASLSPHIDVGADAQYGFSHAYLAGSGWVKVTASDVDSRDFSLFLSAAYRGGSIAAFQPSEWALGAGFGWVPSPERFKRFLITGRAERGQRTGGVIARLGGRYYFPITF